jgi:hypothetical protein
MGMMIAFDRIAKALVELDDLGGALRAWDPMGALTWRLDDLDDLLSAALRDLEMRRPHDLTPGQELMARFDAVGLFAVPWNGPADARQSGLRVELGRVLQRTDYLRRARDAGRWYP